MVLFHGELNFSFFQQKETSNHIWFPHSYSRHVIAEMHLKKEVLVDARSFKAPYLSYRVSLWTTQVIKGVHPEGNSEQEPKLD